jgi:hypothetical protein
MGKFLIWNIIVNFYVKTYFTFVVEMKCIYDDNVCVCVHMI